MRTPLEEDERPEEDAPAEAEETPLRLKDKHKLDIDGEFRGGKCRNRPQRWKEIIQACNEIHLDEIRVLLERGAQCCGAREYPISNPSLAALPSSDG